MCFIMSDNYWLSRSIFQEDLPVTVLVQGRGEGWSLRLYYHQQVSLTLARNTLINMKYGCPWGCWADNLFMLTWIFNTEPSAILISCHQSEGEIQIGTSSRMVSSVSWVCYCLNICERWFSANSGSWCQEVTFFYYFFKLFKLKEIIFKLQSNWLCPTKLHLNILPM